jgi:hypothetical protein
MQANETGGFVTSLEGDPYQMFCWRNLYSFIFISGLFDGCYLNRETRSEVEKAGFSKVEFVEFQCQMKAWFFLYMNPIPYEIYGWATK